jgi:hypothetical protein
MPKKILLKILIMNQCASKVYKWVTQSGVQCVGLKASMEEFFKKTLGDFAFPCNAPTMQW